MEIDPTSVAFGVYSDASSGILIPAYDGGVSKIRFLANGSESTIFNSPTSGCIFQPLGSATISGTDVNLNPTSGYVRISSWNQLFNNSTLSTLQDILDQFSNTTAASNMTFDPTSRNLKLWSATGILLAQVNIPK